jgi:coproporphyrinogen III oxidase
MSTKGSDIPFRTAVQRSFEALQDTICTEMERLDGGKGFREDRWDRRTGGGGITRVLEEGVVLEKAGVNTSAVWGTLPERMAQRMNVEPGEFFATGISLVIHPVNPMVPTVHMNLRYFEMDSGSSWFGGGADLTPYYIFREDCAHFHRTLKDACDRHDPAYYPRFKKWCDEYFFITHRNEARGIGGIFFDYLREGNNRLHNFVTEVGNAFLPAYKTIVERRMHEPYTDDHRQWQSIRRGRYVEFNLVYDRGTLFGLETDGRVESILMSLPPSVSWKYDYVPPGGSPEAELIRVLQRPVDWI